MKAGNSICHSLLIHIFKLLQYELQAKTTNGIQNWLDDRQTVAQDGGSLEVISVDSGIPKGSVLDPKLFLFNINDLQFRLHSKVILLADDTIIYIILATENDFSFSKILK